MKNSLDPVNIDLSSHVEKINQRLKEIIGNSQTPYQSLFESANYSLDGKAKRIRPLLAIITTETLKGSAEMALTPACALELVHTYSLIHDDLPCMDDDDIRRGKPSLHKAYSESQAILTGDFLLTLAFQLLANDPLLSPDKKVTLISTLAHASGAEGLIGGQVMDLDEETADSIDLLKETHLRKTALPIRCAVAFGAIIAEAKEKIAFQLLSYGEKIGLAFQVIDDVLDVTSEIKRRGKEKGPDIENHKQTYTTYLGIDGAKRYAEELLASALDDLAAIPYHTENLEHIAHLLVKRSW